MAQFTMYKEKDGRSTVIKVVGTSGTKRLVLQDGVIINSDIVGMKFRAAVVLSKSPQLERVTVFPRKKQVKISGAGLVATNNDIYHVENLSKPIPKDDYLAEMEDWELQLLNDLVKLL